MYRDKGEFPPNTLWARSVSLKRKILVKFQGIRSNVTEHPYKNTVVTDHPKGVLKGSGSKHVLCVWVLLRGQTHSSTLQQKFVKTLSNNYYTGCSIVSSKRAVY